MTSPDKDGRKLVSVTVEDATISSSLEGDNYIIRLDYTIVRRWERPLLGKGGAG